MDNFFQKNFQKTFFCTCYSNPLYKIYKFWKSFYCFQNLKYFDNILQLKIIFPITAIPSLFLTFLTSLLQKDCRSLTDSLKTLFFPLENSSDRQNGTIVCLTNLDTTLLTCCVNDLAISDIQCHMSGITDQVAGLCILQTTLYSITLPSL